MMDVGMEETGNREGSWVLLGDLCISYSLVSLKFCTR